MNEMPVCWLRSPTCHETTSLESASMAVHVQTSPTVNATIGHRFIHGFSKALRTGFPGHYALRATRLVHSVIRLFSTTCPQGFQQLWGQEGRNLAICSSW